MACGCKNGKTKSASQLRREQRRAELEAQKQQQEEAEDANVPAQANG